MVDTKKIRHIKQSKPFSLIDLAAIALSLIACISIIVVMCTNKTSGELAIINQHSYAKTTQFDLNINQEIHLDCHNGEYKIVIENGKIKIASAACRGQDCVQKGAIYLSGDQIICTEARLSITIKGRGKLDAIS